MAGDQERLDVVIFGASGFTGERIAHYAIRKKLKEPSFEFGLADRNMDELRSVMDRFPVTEWTIKYRGLQKFEVECALMEATVELPETVLSMCRKAKVIINCVGPYRIYGEQVVKACLDACTHYVDISGEPQASYGSGTSTSSWQRLS